MNSESDQLGFIPSLAWPAATAIALMSFTESIAAARAFARPGEPRPLPNQELLALGMANVGGGFFGAMPAGGGTTQTAVNRSAGARTQMAGLVTAGAALATLLLLAPLIALMPQAALAAVVVAYSVDVIDIEYTALKMLTEAEETPRRDGITLWLAALNPDVLTVVKGSSIGETLGRERLFFNLQTAVEKYARAG